MASEGKRGEPMAEEVLKRVTGQDTISARYLRKEFFSFRPAFLLMMSTNHDPYIRGVDEGFWRRVRLIHFRRYFETHERDRDLQQRLVGEEAQGILAWGVRGAVNWYAAGQRLPACQSIDAATDTFREDSDVLEEFLAKHLVREKGSIVEAQDIISRYADWCFERNEEPYKQKTVRSMLAERLGPVLKTALPRHHRHWRLLTLAEVAAQERLDRKALANSGALQGPAHLEVEG